MTSQQTERSAGQTHDGRKAVIELHDVKRDFVVGDEVVHALRGVSFKIYEGEFVTIMGTSGSGKSTLLNQLGCLDTPTSGEYFLDGISVRQMKKAERAVLRNKKIGFVFQNYNLLPKTTSIENVELPLMYNPSISAKERKERAVKALQVGCSKQMSKTYAFFAYSFTSFDNQIRGKVDISPFFDMAMSTCFQSFFEIEINTSGFISKMKT